MSVHVPLWMWFVFAGIVCASLAIDLLSHRGGHGLGRRAAIAWSVGWIALALGFALWVALQFGNDAGEDFVTAYLIEKSLSIDNLFVFLVVFQRLKIPDSEQHRVLFWGIFGALVARGLFIAAGTASLARWHTVVYILGALLIVTGWKTLRAHKASGERQGRVLQWIQRYLPTTPTMHGHKFLAVVGGRRVATPLLLALISIELTDIMFAVDSVPAVLAISNDPFIVYSSNVFAILGLRALYLVLAGLLADLKYIHVGLAAILIMAGTKMLVSSHLHLPHWVSLLAVVVILIVSVGASLWARRNANA